jgi:hypothetical protein
VIHINVVCDDKDCRAAQSVEFEKPNETWGLLLSELEEFGWTLTLDENKTKVLKSLCPKHQEKL